MKYKKKKANLERRIANWIKHPENKISGHSHKKPGAIK